MADEGEEQEGAQDIRIQLVQQYCLKTTKQVGNLVNNMHYYSYQYYRAVSAINAWFFCYLIEK